MMVATCYNKSNPQGVTSTAAGSNQSNLLMKGRAMAISQSTGELPPLPVIDGVLFRHIAGFIGYSVGDPRRTANMLRKIADILDLQVGGEFLPEIPWAPKDTFIPEIPWRRDGNQQPATKPKRSK